MKTRAAALFAIALGLGACGEEPPPPRFPVTVTTDADGQRLAGVRVSANGAPIGQTGPDGTLHVELTGPEGSPVQIGATCPEGYRQPTALPMITLRRVNSLDPAVLARGLPVSIACPPAERHGVVVVRAGGDQAQPNIPVMIDGREVARTDGSGVAHVALDMQPGQSFQVLLATNDFPNLRPQSPRQAFVFPDADELFIFDQRFEIELPPPPRVRRRRTPPEPQPVMPVRIPPTRR